MSRLRWPDSTNSVSEKPGTIRLPVMSFRADPPVAVAGRSVTHRCGMSSARMSSKLPSLFTLSGASSVMSTGPDQKSLCLINSQLRPCCFDDVDARSRVRTSTHEPLSL